MSSEKQKNKKLGLFGSAGILIGGMVGSAIYSLSGATIVSAGPASILSWVLAGLMLFSYGLLCAELSTMYPGSGGVFTFPAKTLGKNERQGRLWGWVSSWAYLFGCWGGVAFSAIYIGTYLGVGFPALGKYQVPLALGAVLVCGLLNVFSISVTGKANTVLSIGKIATLLVFVAIAFFSGKWQAGNFVPVFTQGTDGPLGFLGAIPVAMVAYGSIVAVAFMVGEIRNPQKTVPRAMAVAMVFSIAVYVLVMVATLGLVTTGFLQQNPDMAYIPLFAAAFTQLQFVPWLSQLISISAVLALLTTILVLIAMTSRMFAAAAQGGILPSSLGKMHPKTGSPVRATIVVTLLFAALSVFPSITGWLVDMGSLCNAAVVAIICVTIIKARKTHPNAPFKAPGGNVLPVITLALLLASYLPGILAGGWRLWALSAGYFLVGMLVYALSYFAHKKQAGIKE